MKKENEDENLGGGDEKGYPQPLNETFNNWMYCWN